MYAFISSRKYKKNSCRFKFQYTNNVAKYKYLIQGLRKALDLGVECLRA